VTLAAIEALRRAVARIRRRVLDRPRIRFALGGKIGTVVYVDAALSHLGTLL
jgi:hypothetical protein